MTNSRSVRKIWKSRPTRDKLSARRRAYGMTPRCCSSQAPSAHDEPCCASFQVLPLIAHLDEPQRTEKKNELLRIFAALALQWKELLAVPPELNSPLSRIRRVYPCISDFSDELIHDMFRFDSQEQLRHLLAAFPNTLRDQQALFFLRRRNSS